MLTSNTRCTPIWNTFYKRTHSRRGPCSPLTPIYITIYIYEKAQYIYIYIYICLYAYMYVCVCECMCVCVCEQVQFNSTHTFNTRCTLEKRTNSNTGTHSIREHILIKTLHTSNTSCTPHKRTHPNKRTHSISIHIDIENTLYLYIYIRDQMPVQTKHTRTAVQRP
jgi:hypothetical protein